MSARLAPTLLARAQRFSRSVGVTVEAATAFSAARVAVGAAHRLLILAMTHHAAMTHHVSAPAHAPVTT